MDAIVRQIFRRLCELDPTQEESKLAANDAASNPDELRMNVQALPQEGVETSKGTPEKSSSQESGLDVPEDADPRSPSSSSMTRIECAHTYLDLTGSRQN